MRVIELAEEMQNICLGLRNQGRRLRFIPTMGALHNGHGSLISQAATEPIKHNAQTASPIIGMETSLSSDPLTRAKPENSAILIVSIFVNPKQFNSTSDYTNYPSTMAQDLDFCRRLNVDYVFAPSVSEMYPGQGAENCMIEAPKSIDQDLEGGSRSGHFKGVLTVVCKLFNIVKPHDSYFGEKDYQQLILVSKMVRDLNMDVVIRPGPTVRDSDLLPLSSRNVRLNSKQRQSASIMYKILLDAKQVLESSSRPRRQDIEQLLYASSMTTICLNLSQELAEMVQIDYLELRSRDSFSKIHVDSSYDPKPLRNHRFLDSELTRNGDSIILSARLLIAIVVGGVRLLDNIGLTLNLGAIGGDTR